MGNALIVGGTGPIGPHLAQGLLDRGYDVTIFHRGVHEPPELPEVRHIHGDPHFRETISEALGDAHYDVVFAMYGRTRYVAEVLAGRAGQFVAIGGAPRYAGFNSPGQLVPAGLPIPVSEDDPTADVLPDGLSREADFSKLMLATERAVLDHHPTGSILIYPAVVYGPRNLIPWEWSIVKRVLDGRRAMVLPDGGTGIHTRGSGRNTAHAALLLVDRPEAAAGQIFNCGEDVQYSLHQWVSLICDEMGHEMEMVGVPHDVAPLYRAIYLPMSTSLSTHAVLDTSKIRDRLGYTDLLTTAESLRESIAWYRANPIDPSRHAGYFDRFDYAEEDELMAAWTEAKAGLRARFDRHELVDHHPMPHPKVPGQGLDHRMR